MSGPAFPPCIDCGEPDSGTCFENRCRECDIESVVASASCRECLRFIMREEFGGPRDAQHAPGCSLRDEVEYYARDEVECRRLREAKFGWVPELVEPLE